MTDYEEALWSHGFYSSLAAVSHLLSSNHIQTLKKAVNIPNSLSTNSVAAGLLELPQQEATPRTGVMKISPSLKALEKILNTDKPGPVTPILEEEDDDFEAPVPNEKSSFPDSHLQHKTVSDDSSAPVFQHHMLSTQTFHTAHLGDAQDSVPSTTSTRRRSSVSTAVDSAFGDADNTPPITQEAQLYTVRQTSKDFLPTLKPVVPDAATFGTADDLDLENESTLHGDVPPAVPPKETTPKTTIALPQTSTTPVVRLMLDVGALPSQESHLAEPFQPKQRTTGSPTRAMAPPAGLSVASVSPTKTSSVFATPTLGVRLSPLSKSSTLKPASPPKRSNTTGDISGLKTDIAASAGAGAGQLKNSKRFSFRGLFKLRSKNHSLNQLGDVDEEPPSRPVKLSKKSQSNPNFGGLILSTPAPEKRGLFRRRKSDATLSGLRLDEPESKPEQLPSVTENVASKNLETLEAHAAVLSGPTHLRPEELSSYPTPQFPATPPAGRTPDTFNLGPSTIKEVDDSDYLPQFDETENAGEDDGGFTNEEEEEEEILEPAVQLSTPKYGEELEIEEQELMRIPLDPKRASTVFGLPFAVEFQSNSPHQERGLGETRRNRLSPFDVLPQRDPRADTRTRDSAPKINELLIGESLFPKSLSAQEVESIVSLERSRSMRSIRSGKRSSFINYDGSDERVVFGDHLLRPGALKRSGSILKTSLSRRSLKVDNFLDLDTFSSMDKVLNDETRYAPETTSLVGSEMILKEDESHFDENVNYEDFIEFTDFIDIEDLDFSSLSESPRLEVETPRDIIERVQDQRVITSSPVSEAENTGVSALENSSDLQEREEVNTPREASTIDAKSGEPHEDADNTFQPSKIPVRHVTSLASPIIAVLPPEKAAVVASPTVRTKRHSVMQTGNWQAPEPFAAATDYSPLSYPIPGNSGLDPVPSEVISVNSQSSAEALPEPERETSEAFNGSRGSGPTTVAQAQSLLPEPEQLPLSSPILDSAYNSALNFARPNPSSTTRPISMSYKGFSGSALQAKASSGGRGHFALAQNLSAELSGVGQGFGSEDEDDEGEDEDEEYDEDDENADASANDLVTEALQPPHVSRSFSANNFPRPPSLLVPFHHNRIPLLSDHSAQSSPRLLSSFISKLRRSPMNLPRVVQVATKNLVRFSSRIILYDTYNCEEYDRHPDVATCNQLTPLLAQRIKEELNEVKSLMAVHDDSRCYTHFF